MSDKEFNNKLKKFAKTVEGRVLESGGNTLVPFDHYKIFFEGGEIELVFGDPMKGGVSVTHETRIRFFLRPECGTNLKAQPMDFLSKLFMVKRQKFGVEELDRTFLFKSNSPGLASQLTETFREFLQQERHKHFFLETAVISDQKVLSVFIPEVVISKLYSVFWLGKNIAQTL
jgi:hypothetical protein